MTTIHIIIETLYATAVFCLVYAGFSLLKLKRSCEALTNKVARCLDYRIDNILHERTAFDHFGVKWELGAYVVVGYNDEHDESQFIKKFVPDSESEEDVEFACGEALELAEILNQK